MCSVRAFAPLVPFQILVDLLVCPLLLGAQNLSLSHFSFFTSFIPAFLLIFFVPSPNTVNLVCLVPDPLLHPLTALPRAPRRPALVSVTHSGVVCCSSCLDRPASSCLPDSWQ